MVQHHDKDVIVGAYRKQLGMEREVCSKVKAMARSLLDIGSHLVLADVSHGQLEPHCARFENALARNAVSYGENGAKSLVPTEEIDDRGVQGLHVEVAAQPHGQRNVVQGIRAFKLGQEPQPLLRERQWNHLDLRGD
jgi:hypothetical protein